MRKMEELRRNAEDWVSRMINYLPALFTWVFVLLYSDPRPSSKSQKMWYTENSFPWKPACTLSNMAAKAGSPHF